ncbi:PH domain-containing protein [Aquibacillus sediminis]|uniref:PH domain-containing protein n=1 Tax=Aquibacillus sediminis TaxID=2574734 RepID=UPI001109939F|nr:PH domain-containing protein [Aquibacillus sediminis]
MRQPPSERIAKDAIQAWKLVALLWLAVPILITVGLFLLAYFFDFSYWLGVIALILSVIEGLITVFLIPKLRWRRWRYQVFEQEIYIQHGILVVSRTLVPMIRVQHVDTKQGPVLKKYGLSSLTISTAATTHEIPALLEEEASDLRDQISELARVEQDDV